MKVKKITYQRAANLGNFESVHFQIEVELGEEDTPGAAVNTARAFVQKAIRAEIQENKKIKRDERGARTE